MDNRIEQISLFDNKDKQNKGWIDLDKVEQTINGIIEQDIELISIEEKNKVTGQNNKKYEWTGDIGDSKRIPKDPSWELAKALSEFGVDGIEYKNGDADFSPVSKYEIEFVNVDTVYRFIGENITIDEIGDKSRSKVNSLIRKKWQNEIKRYIVRQLTENAEYAAEFQQKTGVDTSKVKSIHGLSEELKRNKLSLHETPDCKKIQFIPRILHQSFRHTGGVTEMLEKIIDGDIRIKYRNTHQK